MSRRVNGNKNDKGMELKATRIYSSDVWCIHQILEFANRFANFIKGMLVGSLHNSFKKEFD